MDSNPDLKSTEDPKPPVFISCVSHELGQVRKRVSKVLEKKGFRTVSQDIFGIEPGDLRQMLQRQDRSLRRAHPYRWPCLWGGTAHRGP